MAYRETEQVRARKRAVRQRILAAARAELSRRGFQATQMASLARRAGLATGTLYRYFPTKAQLYAEVFRINSGREVAVFAAAARTPGPPALRLEQAVRRFAERAIAGRRIAYALIAEPVAPEVEAERLIYRRAYAEVLEELLEAGMRSGAFPPQDVRLGAAALVGALAEALVGPLAAANTPLQQRAARRLIQAMVDFSLRAVGATPVTTALTARRRARGRTGAHA